MNVWIAAPAACLVLAATPALAQHQGHGAAPAQQAEPAQEHQGHDAHQGHGQQGHEGHEVSVRDMPAGVLGPYAMGREASGTAWQPDATPHGGLHGAFGGWTTMSHLMLNGVYAWSDGPRGDEQAFVAGMIMGSARRGIGQNGTLNLRAMLSPDPWMGAEGYPLLFAAGETADGATTLVDRQHPHDLFMELSASYSHRIGAQDAVFVYAGLPGEPAFGPPAFMHRLAAMDSPEAPISHHWFDSTHITFGVVTAGWSHDNWRIEASRFRGREPDEHRYDIESGALNSTALRLSWNPNPNWALQVSWADIESPEALHPDEDETRWSISALYTRPLQGGGWVAASLAFANKERSDGASLDAWLAEGAYHPNDRWTFFARGEAIETDELGVPHGPAENVARVSVGAIRDWRINDNAVFGVGALVQGHVTPSALDASYDGDPMGAMAFVRLRIG